MLADAIRGDRALAQIVVSDEALHRTFAALGRGGADESAFLVRVDALTAAETRPDRFVSAVDRRIGERVGGAGPPRTWRPAARALGAGRSDADGRGSVRPHMTSSWTKPRRGNLVSRGFPPNHGELSATYNQIEW